jgi:hypothetical protein
VLLLLSFATIIAIYTVSRFYAGENNRLPSASTPKGKEARVIICGLLVIAVVLIVLNTSGQDLNGKYLAVWIICSVIAIGMPILRYYRSRKR